MTESDEGYKEGAGDWAAGAGETVVRGAKALLTGSVRKINTICVGKGSASGIH